MVYLNPPSPHHSDFSPETLTRPAATLSRSRGRGILRRGNSSRVVGVVVWHRTAAAAFDYSLVHDWDRTFFQKRRRAAAFTLFRRAKLLAAALQNASVIRMRFRISSGSLP